MMEASNIAPHMNVLGSGGVHVGTVDRVEGDRIKLTRTDSPAVSTTSSRSPTSLASTLGFTSTAPLPRLPLCLMPAPGAVPTNPVSAGSVPARAVAQDRVETTSED